MQYIRTIRMPLALVALTSVFACSKGDDRAADSLATDTAALNRDINLAGTDTAAQPQLSDVPAATTPAPAATAPTTSGSRGTTASRPTTTTTRPRTSTSGTTTRPSTSSGTGTSAGSTRTVASGYTFNARSNARICTNTYKVGDTFTATVGEAVENPGSTTIPSGSTVTLRVTEAKRAENVNQEPVLRLAVQSINIGGRSYTPDATVTYVNVDKVRSSTKKDDAKKVIGGAVIGAIAGQVIGKDTRGTVTGAAAGAAAGTAAAAATGNYDGCVGETGRISIRIDQALTLRS